MQGLPDATGRQAGARPRPPGRPSRLGTRGAFTAGLGRQIDPAAPHGYYIDLRAKAQASDWPPGFYDPRRDPDGSRLHAVIIQWGLGCYERFLAGEGEQWLAGAIACAEHLLVTQERGGRHDGGWVQRLPYRHTFPVAAPWVSGMAQGEAASLLVRIHRTTGDERFAEAALRAMSPLRTPIAAGGAAAELNGGWLPQEYPTEPASHVLNGAMFALWGPHDVAIGLGDGEARHLAEAGIAALAAGLDRFDAGYWSLYDLFPHPIRNVASPMYHRLHTDQLRAMALISTDPRFGAATSRFEAYARSRFNLARAYAAKVAFRLAVPRSPVLASRLPWGRAR